MIALIEKDGYVDVEATHIYMYADRGTFNRHLFLQEVSSILKMTKERLPSDAKIIVDEFNHSYIIISKEAQEKIVIPFTKILELEQKIKKEIEKD